MHLFLGVGTFLNARLNNDGAKEVFSKLFSYEIFVAVSVS